jgi:hypothetical protein
MSDTPVNQIHYFYSPFAKYQTSIFHPVTGKKGIVKFTEGRLITDDENLVKALRAHRKFGKHFNETIGFVPRLGISSIVSSQNAVPLDADLIHAANARAFALQQAGAPKSEVEAIDSDISKARELRKAVELNLPGDPTPGADGKHPLDESGAKTIGAVTWTK